MAKNVLRNLLFSFILLVTVNCSTSSTYTRADIEKIIKAICKDEFNIEVTTRETGETLWIYAPFKRLVDSKEEQFESEAIEHIRSIFLSLKRVMLSMDKPPRFYVFVASDIEDKGLDIYQIGFVPDIVKYELQYISQKEFEERVVFIPFENKEALGDRQGKHIAMFDFSLGNFIMYLTLQKINKLYTEGDGAEHVTINDLDGDYVQGTIQIRIDAVIDPTDTSLPRPSEAAKEILSGFLKIYRDMDFEISLIEIEDVFYEKRRSYSPRALLED